MTTEELQEQGAIYFDKITDGFRDYKDVKLVMDEKRALAHFKNLKKEYGNNNAFADFYYYRLDMDSREMVDEVLTDAEKTYLNLMMPEDLDQDIIFPLETFKNYSKIKCRGNVIFYNLFSAEWKSRRKRTDNMVGKL